MHVSATLPEFLENRLGFCHFVAIFLDDDEYVEETTFAVKNTLKILRAKTTYQVTEHIIKLSKESSFEAGQFVCDLIRNGVSAIFGPESPENNEIIQSVAASLQIPYFQNSWNPQEEAATSVFNLRPNSDALSRALAALVRENDWKTYTVMYENEDSLLRLRETLKQRKPNDLSIAFICLGSGPDYRTVLKQIKKTLDTRFILDCKADRILDIFRQAKEVGLLKDYHSYILTDLDAHSLDWSEFNEVVSNISSIRLMDHESDAAKNIGKLWRIDPKRIKTRMALIYDAVNVFITAFRDLSQKEQLQIKPLDCDGSEVTEYGTKMYEVIKKPSKQSKPLLSGYLTGPVLFDQHGQRRNLILQIVERSKPVDGAFRLTGYWNSALPKNISYTVTSAQREKELQKEIQTKNFKVVSKLGDPYLLKKTSKYGKELFGNDRYEGYALDLMHEICSILNCSFTIELVADGKYGNFDPVTKEWNGLIRHLLDRVMYI
ncbi:glutamate receptor ionotropic, kainate 2-like [Dendroctonus ponderosae]|uniref:glutamate receptor ionotropic, kainate 2-like n=2 Tax=Dendroctonus ponderosae TaxID=77166 RepID=UPI002035D93C|nr:glutamate receptor ionotropic, kainate 2-like [Dendroctonus ponderosae]